MLRARVLVVTYECDWQDSETLQSLQSLASSGAAIDLVIWDNSLKARQDEAVLASLHASLNQVRSIHCPENQALSKVYNTVAEMPGEYDVLVLLDQDTRFDEGYFLALFDAVAHVPTDVFLPVVRSQDLIVSPGSYFLVKGRHWREAKLGLQPSKGVVAISSGLAVTRNYLRAWPKPFDERMSLYGIDTAFMLDYARRVRSLYVMDYVLQHHTMLWSNPPKATMLFRFKNLRRARLLMHHRQPLHYFLALGYAAVSTFRMAVRYREPAFFLPLQRNEIRRALLRSS